MSTVEEVVQEEFRERRRALLEEQKQEREQLLNQLDELRRQSLGSAQRVTLLDQAKDFVKSSSPPTMVEFLPRILKLKDKPFNLDDHFPFEPFYHTLVPQMQVWKTGRQVAKTCRISEFNRVSLANGQQVPGHDLKIGDKLLSFDRFHAAYGVVTDKIYSGYKEVLRVTTRLGSVVEIATTHPLRTLHGWRRGGDLRVFDRIAAARTGGCFGRRTVSDRVLLTAYMLGDGCYGLSGNWSFTAAPGQALREFIQLACCHEAKDLDVKQRDGSVAYQVRLHSDNNILRWADEDGLTGKGSAEKFFPAWVFELTRAASIAFISRLWATDGQINTSSTGSPEISYCSTSWRLAHDLKAMLTKFGIPTSVTKKRAAYRDKSTDELIECQDAYILRVETRPGWSKFLSTFSVPDKPAVSLPASAENNNRDTVPIEIGDIIAEIAGECRGTKQPKLRQVGLRKKPKHALTYGKLARYVKFFRKYRATHPKLQLLEDLLDQQVIWDEIVSIESVGRQQCWDVEVKSHHNYVLNGLLSHNSTNLAASGIIRSNCVRNYNTLFVTPLYEMIRRFSSNYVQKFIESSPFNNAWTSSKTSSNVLQRSFRNNSTMHFSYALLDADRTRGINCDELCIDEAQDMNPEFIPIMREVLSASPWALEKFAGTPKTTDGTLEQLWLDSSQAEWCIRCHACNKLNIPCLSEDLDKMIGNHRDVSEEKPGVICAKCSRPINPRTGRWIHRYPERAWEFAGRHVPQILLPMHYAKPKKWGMLLDKKEGRYMIAPNVFYNEVLGESYDTSAKLVSETDLRRVSILNENTLEAAKIARQKYEFVILAADWGGGGTKGISWTAYALLGWNSDGTIDVIYGYRSLTPHDADGEAKLTLRLLNEFKPNYFVHDFTGAGRLREQFVINSGYPYERVIPMWLVGTMANQIVKPVGLSESCAREHYKVDKPRSLSLTCNGIRNGRIRFFKFDKERSSSNVSRDFLSLMEDKLDSRLGRDVYTIIRDKNRPDDFAQAVNLGVMAMYEHFNAFPDLSEFDKYNISDDLLEQLSPDVPLWSQN